ncbi:MAG: hypothetical protein IJU66_04520 [Oscillospiraceae bacterium]|nr:hypothetical protein [Oscillospiraceae bacterium]
MNVSNERSAAPYSDTIAFALSALTGVMGAAASGAGLRFAGADGVPQLAAAAIPGVFVFLLSRLMAQGAARPAEAAVPALPLPAEDGEARRT